MADILIREFEMPETCGQCPIFNFDYNICNILSTHHHEYETSRIYGCPLVELPEHGEWIEDRMDYKCSACCKTVKDEIIYMLEPYQFPAFCPYCGVKLETPKEETE